MNTVGRILDTGAHIVVIGWIYWLTIRVQLLLNHVEQIVDRAHSAPEPSMSWYKQLKAEWLAEYEGLAVDEPEPITVPTEAGRHRGPVGAAAEGNGQTSEEKAL